MTREEHTYRKVNIHAKIKMIGKSNRIVDQGSYDKEFENRMSLQTNMTLGIVIQNDSFLL